eukprot:SAG31_NODE_5657_length_2401_cov_2.239357_1_plen_191_part_00
MCSEMEPETLQVKELESSVPSSDVNQQEVVLDPPAAAAPASETSAEEASQLLGEDASPPPALPERVSRRRTSPTIEAQFDEAEPVGRGGSFTTKDVRRVVHKQIENFKHVRAREKEVQSKVCKTIKSFEFGCVPLQGIWLLYTTLLVACMLFSAVHWTFVANSLEIYYREHQLPLHCQVPPVCQLQMRRR